MKLWFRWPWCWFSWFEVWIWLLFNQNVSLLTDWLIDWWNDWLIDWLIDWWLMIDWSIWRSSLCRQPRRKDSMEQCPGVYHNFHTFISLQRNSRASTCGISISVSNMKTGMIKNHSVSQENYWYYGSRCLQNSRCWRARHVIKDLSWFFFHQNVFFIAI